MADINNINISIPPAAKVIPKVETKVEAVVPKEISYGRECLIKAIKEIKLENLNKITSNKYIKKKFNDIFTTIENNSLGDFLSIDKNLSISYAKDKTNPFDEKKRINTTFGRYVRRILGISNKDIQDYLLDDVSCCLSEKLLVAKDDEIKLLSGEEIALFYKKTNITSCMTGSHSNLTELYALNPDKINLAVYTKDNKVLARAVLWTTDDGSKILDRVYPVGSKNIFALINWAKGKGYITKTDGKFNKQVITVKAENHIPYLDTFVYCCVDKKNKTYELSNSRSKPHMTYVQDTLKYIGSYSTREQAVLPWVETYRCHLCYYNFLQKNIKELNINGKTKKICDHCYKTSVKTCSCCKKSYFINYDCHKSYCKDCTKENTIRCNRCHMYKIKGKDKIYNAKLFGGGKQVVKFCSSCVKNYCYVVIEEAKTVKSKAATAKSKAVKAVKTKKATTKK